MLSGIGRGRESHFEPPIELRFVDLFMIIVTALMFVAVMLSVISAAVGRPAGSEQPRITTTALPTALVGRPYEVTLAAEGGTPPYRWQIEGELPSAPDLRLVDPTLGVIRGTARKVDRTEFTVRVSDGGFVNSEPRRLSLATQPAGRGRYPIKARIHLASEAVALPDAVAGQFYGPVSLQAEGGTPPYVWSVAPEDQRALAHAGLRLYPDGRIEGTPGVKHSAVKFSVHVADNTEAFAVGGARLLIRRPAQTLWRRAMGWAVKGVEWLCYGLVALSVFITVFIGTGPTPAIPSLVAVLRDRLRRR